MYHTRYHTSILNIDVYYDMFLVWKLLMNPVILHVSSGEFYFA